MEEKKYRAGGRVAMSGKGKKMGKEEMGESGIKEGDKVLCIDPESGMIRTGEDKMHWTIYEGIVTKVSRFTGIRTQETAHNYLREDGLWSDENDEVNE